MIYRDARAGRTESAGIGRSNARWQPRSSAIGRTERQSGIAEAVGSTPEEFASFIRTEQAKWGKVVREGGVKPDRESHILECADGFWHI
jgi:hypothetical protein